MKAKEYNAATPPKTLHFEKRVYSYSHRDHTPRAGSIIWNPFGGRAHPCGHDFYKDEYFYAVYVPRPPDNTPSPENPV